MPPSSATNNITWRILGAATLPSELEKSMRPFLNTTGGDHIGCGLPKYNAAEDEHVIICAYLGTVFVGFLFGHFPPQVANIPSYAQVTFVERATAVKGQRTAIVDGRPVPDGVTEGSIGQAMLWKAIVLASERRYNYLQLVAVHVKLLTYYAGGFDFRCMDQYGHALPKAASEAELKRLLETRKKGVAVTMLKQLS